MSKAIVPNTFRTGAIVDVDNVNENIDAIRSDVMRNLSERYHHTSITFPLDGMANTDSDAARTLAIPTVSTGGNIEIVGVELRIECSGGATWTCTLSSWAGMLTHLSANPSFTATSGNPGVFATPAVTGGTGNFSVLLSASGASTISNGSLIFHVRIDRHLTGWRTTAIPTSTINHISQSGGTAGFVLDAPLEAIEDYVEPDTNNTARPCAVVCLVRGLASGSTATFRLPATNRTGMRFVCFVGGDVGDTITATFSGTSVAALNGAGASVIAASAESATFTNSGTDPVIASSSSSPDDIICTLVAGGGGTVESAFVVAWFK